MNKKKVLFFLPGGVGGAERVSVTISRLLPDEEYVKKIIIIDKQKGEIEKFVPQDTEIQFVKVLNVWDFVTLRMVSIIRREKPDFVFSSIFHLNPRLLIAAKLTGTKCIVRNSNMLIRARKDVFFLMKHTYPLAYHIIAQQDEMKRELLDKFHLDPHLITTLQNPLDLAALKSGIKASSPYENIKQHKYVWIARFGYQKGQDILIRAFNLVRKKDPLAHLYLIGKYNNNSNFDQKVFQYIKDENISDYVHIVGFDSNPYRWLAHCDCFVAPSRWEGLPNALIEASYLGKPCAATRCIPIISRIIVDGANGFTCEPENPQDLAKAMINAIGMEVQRVDYKAANNDDFIRLFQ